MLNAGVGFDAGEERIPESRSGSASAMRELFLPLDRLLVCGGDPRLNIDPASWVNTYGCRPFPCPGTLSLAASTAPSVSQPAYDRAWEARAELVCFPSSVRHDR